MSPTILAEQIKPLLSILHRLEDRYADFVNQLTTAENMAQQLQILPGLTLTDFSAEWLAMLDANPEIDPYQRAVVGRVLGILDIDPRPGVGLNQTGLPSIDWVEIPAGDFIFQEGEQLSLPAFYISRYHITYKQFAAFLRADDGFVDNRWWQGLAEKKERHEIQTTMPQQVFRFWNHPFDGACWYDAIAFCRWWSYRLGGRYELDRVSEWKVRLPTEQEWEKVARGTDGRRYPWGNEWKSGYANFDETDRFNVQELSLKIQSGRIGDRYYGGPTAVGIFPHGASPYGVMDMVGTIWDITLTDYRHGKNDDLSDYYPRVIRGGTWFTSEAYCNNLIRIMHHPHARTNGDPRKNDYGFRVCAPEPL